MPKQALSTQQEGEEKPQPAPPENFHSHDVKRMEPGTPVSWREPSKGYRGHGIVFAFAPPEFPGHTVVAVNDRGGELNEGLKPLVLMEESFLRDETPDPLAQ